MYHVQPRSLFHRTYGSYERLTDDGLTQWHPAFLRLGSSLEECAQKYKGFCNRYKPKSKSPRKCHWGSKILGFANFFRSQGTKKATLQRSPKKPYPCQLIETELVGTIVRQFVEANRAPWEVEKEGDIISGRV